MIEHIDESNFVIFAAKHYDNPQCLSTAEFLDDMSRFKYLKKLFNRYDDSGELKERLIINHLIVLFNCFNNETPRMLFLKMGEYGRYLKPFLVYLNRMPDKIEDIGYDHRTIIASNVKMDKKIVETLRSL